MVVQRGARIPVWGWATPGTKVTGRFRGAVAHGTADTSGRWMLTFPAAPAGGPHTLTVDAAGEQRTIGNVLVGDVWVASGQSNMEFTLSGATNAAAEIAAAHDSSIREFKVPVGWAEQPAPDVAGGEWRPADPEHVGNFSAVAYVFARELRRAQHVPIGIINTTWGGSAIETWLSAETQGLNAEGPKRALAAERARIDSVSKAMRARFGNLERDAGLVDGTAVWAAPTLGDTGWTNIRVPALWEEQGYADIDGVAWYRKTFVVDSAQAGSDAQLSLGMIDDDDITWVNGVEVGRTKGYNIPRHYTVARSALRAGTNVVAVRVSDGGGGGGIYGSPGDLRVDFPSVSRSLAGDWKFRIGQIGFQQMDGQRINKIPALTWNRMVHPLLPIAIKGVIWYQGEANANSDDQARAYKAQLRQLITSWRAQWNGGAEPRFPFLWVQLPNFTRPDSQPTASGGDWAILRESMTAALALPNTGQAVTIDIGEADDIHPKNKVDVGKRLALVGRRVAYGEQLLTSGPTYRSHTVKGARVTVQFANRGRGLVSKGNDGSVGAFALAGADRRFVWAQARIEGNHVVVWSDRVPNPVAVRYAWANNPSDANLYNREGLPAAPFRTDRW
jgi:sialate O-acetylesterase